MRSSLSSTTSLSPGSNVARVRVLIEHVPLARLKQPDHLTRKHGKQQIRRIAKSIAEHGFVVPITVRTGDIIASGNARYEAAKLLGLEEVPIIRLEHLSDEQARLFAIADNKLAEGGSWDLDALRVEFAAITLDAPEINLDSSGFTIGERDVIIGRHRTDELADLDDTADAENGTAVSIVGDVWLLGRHRLVCGDARDPAVIARAVGNGRVRTMLSDPPYNVKINGHVSGLGKKKHREFNAAAGEMGVAEFTAFLASFIEAAQPHMIDGALAYIFMDWRHIGNLLAAAEDRQLAYLNLLVWAKTNAGMGSFYRSRHELVGLFRTGSAPHINNVALGANGRYRTNVLEYPGINTFSKGRNKSLELHPTVKPVAMMADLILDSSAPGELILDPFGGSGTTLIAAEKTDRTAALVELDPGYVDVIIRRFEAATGERVIHEESGATFADVGAERASTEEK